MKFGLRFWAWNFLARNTENHRPECPEKSASEISCQNVSKSRRVGCQKSAFGGENPRKIRVGQESVGLNDWGGGAGLGMSPFAWSGALERCFALVF